MSVAFSVYSTPQVDKMQAEFETVRQYVRQHRDPAALSALITAIKFAVTEHQGTHATGGETERMFVPSIMLVVTHTLTFLSSSSPTMIASCGMIQPIKTHILGNIMGREDRVLLYQRGI